MMIRAEELWVSGRQHERTDKNKLTHIVGVTGEPIGEPYKPKQLQAWPAMDFKPYELKSE